MQTDVLTQLVPASAAARLMGCSVDTVYRNLTPAAVVPNGTPAGLKLYAEADALAWQRRRAPRRSHTFASRCDGWRAGQWCTLEADHDGRHAWES